MRLKYLHCHVIKPLETGKFLVNVHTVIYSLSNSTMKHVSSRFTRKSEANMQYIFKHAIVYCSLKEVRDAYVMEKLTRFRNR